MSLWRLSYTRAKVPKQVTFSAADLIAAMDFYEIWERHADKGSMEMDCLGHSRFNQRRREIARSKTESSYLLGN